MAIASNKIGNNLHVFMEPNCKHTRTEVIARRDGVEYVECLDCRQIFEAEDLEAMPAYDDEEQN
jgi:Zn ribbon nucleic-acid-binding protein